MNLYVFKSHKLLLMVLVFLASIPARVLACSCSGPFPLGFMSSNGEIPSNAKGLLWQGDLRKDQYNAENLPFQILNAQGNKEPITFEVFSHEQNFRLFLVKPSRGFIPGEKYTFTSEVGHFEKLMGMAEWNNLKAQKVEISVNQMAFNNPKHPYILDVGTLSEKKVYVPAGGSCGWEVATSAIPIDMVIPVKYRHFKDQLHYETWIDGNIRWYPAETLCDQFIPGSSWLNKKGSDLIYTNCNRWSAEYGIQPGKHTVEMRAYLPGTDVEIKSQVKEIDLSCPQNVNDE